MALFNCPECGKSISDKAESCPNCGYKLDPAQAEPPQPPPPPVGKQPKRNGWLWIVVVALFGFIMFIIVSIAIVTSQLDKISSTKQPTGDNAHEESPEQSLHEKLLEFDDRTWKDFKKLYIAHNNFMAAIAAFSDGNISALTLYDYCSNAEEDFRGLSTSFSYDTDDDERTYLQTFITVALADQIAVQYMKKYIDSNKIEDLSKANEEIQRAKEGFVIISSNRGILLSRTELTLDEIAQKIESDIAELEEESNN